MSPQLRPIYSNFCYVGFPLLSKTFWENPGLTIVKYTKSVLKVLIWLVNKCIRPIDHRRTVACTWDEEGWDKVSFGPNKEMSKLHVFNN